MVLSLAPTWYGMVFAMGRRAGDRPCDDDPRAPGIPRNLESVQK